MSKYFSHLNTATRIVQQYKGEMPLAAYLKSFFASEKKYGSQDRRSIANMCYACFRTGNMLRHLPVEERIRYGLYLTNTLPAALETDRLHSITSDASITLEEKLNILELDVHSIFSGKDQLSIGIEQDKFCRSFLLQPKLFIRLRPGKRLLVERKLKEANVKFETMGEHCLAFENGTRIETILHNNQEYVVQDYNSQQVFTLLSPVQQDTSSLTVWDCCAASGGKAIFAHDIFPNLQLTVSDVRPSILHNLSKRLQQAGIKHYHSFTADLTNEAEVDKRFSDKPFDLIICDAPCSGSGTWSRTPEQLNFFTLPEIDRYNQLQKKIAANASRAIKQNGYLLYVTCSVFKKENEEVVDYLLTHFPLELVEMQLFKGYTMQADSMFAALLKVV